MLVLSRMPKQSIVIDGIVEITVERVKGKRVRLSVAAPPEVKILRGELLETDRKENGGIIDDCD